jgi:lysozyme family protein
VADFETDYTFMMANEDAAQAHAVVADAPPGAHAISGINSAAYPADFARIAAIPQAQRGSAVEQFYRDNFWNRYAAQLSDKVEERELDMAVNGGPGTAVMELQMAINALGGEVAVDGVWGPATVAAANACDQDALKQAFAVVRVAHYRDIVARNPALAVDLPRWIARANK